QRPCRIFNRHRKLRRIASLRDSVVLPPHPANPLPTAGMQQHPPFTAEQRPNRTNPAQPAVRPLDTADRTAAHPSDPRAEIRPNQTSRPSSDTTNADQLRVLSAIP